MTFLPIVERELRVAARKRGTFWSRVVAALVALFIAGGFMLVALSEAVGTAQLGGPLFKTLTWMSLALALAAGLFFTSDCLSEEKREGTLGFLFLTDLRGYDVVLGKLLATSLRCAFALVAIFPILAITQLMGGVDPAQFWKTLLALVHAMFFSLATGMFVSALSRNGQKAMSGTLFMMIIFLAAGPMIDGAIAAAEERSFRPWFSFSSPGYVFVMTDGWPAMFWNALLASQGVAWAMLLAACVLIRRNWQEKSSQASPTLLRWRYWWKYGGAKRHAVLRQKLLAVNPVAWLAGRDRWQRISIWIVAGVITIGYLALFVLGLSSDWWRGWSLISGAMPLLFYLWMTSQACQFFAEARRSGLVEMLLSTPLNSHQLVHGPWRALVRTFAIPIGLYLLVQIVVPILIIFGDGNRAWGGVSRSIAGAAGGQSMWLWSVVSALDSAVVTVANLVALGWFGMWMGLASKNARLATLKTIVFVQILPWFVMTLATVLAMAFLMMPMIAKSGVGTSPTWYATWYPLVTAAVTTLLALGKDAFFFFWARRKLLGDFREIATRTMAPIPSHSMPPVIAIKP
jgi:ABC-type transport system involved in multi-copper enzyme maturation permease subunit